MKFQIMLVAFYICDLPRRNLLRSVWDLNIVGFTPVNMRQSFFKFDAEQLISQWFHKKIEGIHFIALQRILRHACDKDKAGVVPSFPQCGSCFQTIHMRHCNIHKNQVAISLIVIQKIHTVLKYRNFVLRFLFFSVLFYIL